MSLRIPRRLDPVEIRVLGSLLEKEQTTPELYPLSLNALVAACNQKTNRDPVLELGESEVAAAVERLRQDVLVWRTDGARVERFKQSVDRRWDLDPPAKAVLTLLFLRGPQTTGELRERTQRLHPFPTLEDMERELAALAGQEEPLICQLSRRPGQKETRWSHLLGDGDGALEAAGGGVAAAVGAPPAGGRALSAPIARPAAPVAAPLAGPTAATVAELLARLDALERRVERLEGAPGRVGEPES